LSDHVRSYVERDVRTLLNVGDLETFERFLRLCAGRIGQIVDHSSLAIAALVSASRPARSGEE
jgi:hypothetical protein